MAAHSSPEGFLPAHRCQFVDVPMTWQEAIRLSVQPLVDDQIVDLSYVDAIFASLREHGPYIDLGFGFAVPHAQQQGNVTRSGLAFLRTNVPVLLMNDPNHKIEAFIALAAPDSDSHIELISTLADLLTDEASRSELKNSHSGTHIASLFANRSK